MNVRPVNITKRAAKEVQRIMQQKQISESFALRFDIKGNASGCGGFGFKLGFDSKNESDIEYTSNGVRVFVDKKKVLFLVNTVVDYLDQDGQQGFFFEKAEATSTTR